MKKIIGLSILILILIITGTWAIRYYTAEIRGKVGAAERIESAPARIAAYNHFFDMLVVINSYEAALDAQNDQLEKAQQVMEQERIRSNIAGITAERERVIRQYNADARKSYTIAQFRDLQLPFQLLVKPYKKGERTTW